jgi:hypothetical protein
VAWDEDDDLMLGAVRGENWRMRLTYPYFAASLIFHLRSKKCGVNIVEHGHANAFVFTLAKVQYYVKLAV